MPPLWIQDGGGGFRSETLKADILAKTSRSRIVILAVERNLLNFDLFSLSPKMEDDGGLFPQNGACSFQSFTHCWNVERS